MKKYIIIISILLLIILGIVLGARFFSGEDDWICKDGNWVKHGNPAKEMPAAKCQK